MRRRFDNHIVLLAVFMAVCLLVPCCVSAAHTAEHACSHYDDCRTCQQLDPDQNISLLVLPLLLGCAFIHGSMHLRCDHVRRCFVPVTLISQSIQMND